MANTDNPFGLIPFKTEGKEHRVRYWKKTAASTIYRGDVLTLAAAGTAGVAAAGNPVLGVAAEHKAANESTGLIAVYDDPDAEFICQIDGAWSDPDDIGQCYNILANAGDATRKQSNHELDYSTGDVTATLQFKVLGLLARGTNAAGSNAIVRVKPQSHFLGDKPAGI
jgi:hypothetical protein